MAPTFSALQVSGLRGDSEYVPLQRSRTPSPEASKRTAPEPFIGLASELELIGISTITRSSQIGTTSTSAGSVNAHIRTPTKVPIKVPTRFSPQKPARTLVKNYIQTEPGTPTTKATRNFPLNEKSVLNPTTDDEQHPQTSTSSPQVPSKSHQKRLRDGSSTVEDETNENWDPADRRAWRGVHGLRPLLPTQPPRKKPKTEDGFAHSKKKQAFNSIMSYRKGNSSKKIPPKRLSFFDNSIERSIEDETDDEDLLSPILTPSTFIRNGIMNNHPSLTEAHSSSVLMASTKDETSLFIPEEFMMADDSTSISSSEEILSPRALMLSAEEIHFPQMSILSSKNKHPVKAIPEHIQNMVTKVPSLQVQSAPASLLQTYFKSVSALKTNPYAKSIMEPLSFTEARHSTKLIQRPPNSDTLDNAINHLRTRQTHVALLLARASAGQTTTQDDDTWKDISEVLRSKLINLGLDVHASLALTKIDGDQALRDHLTRLEVWDKKIERDTLLKKHAMYSLQMEEMKKMAKELE